MSGKVKVAEYTRYIMIISDIHSEWDGAAPIAVFTSSYLDDTFFFFTVLTEFKRPNAAGDDRGEDCLMIFS